MDMQLRIIQSYCMLSLFFFINNYVSSIVVKLCILFRTNIINNQLNIVVIVLRGLLVCECNFSKSFFRVELFCSLTVTLKIRKTVEAIRLSYFSTKLSNSLLFNWQQ